MPFLIEKNEDNCYLISAYHQEPTMIVNLAKNLIFCLKYICHLEIKHNNKRLKITGNNSQFHTKRQIENEISNKLVSSHLNKAIEIFTREIQYEENRFIIKISNRIILKALSLICQHYVRLAVYWRREINISRRYQSSRSTSHPTGSAITTLRTKCRR